MTTTQVICKTRKRGPFALQTRPCSEPGCITPLNQWHKGKKCYLHEQAEKARANGNGHRESDDALLRGAILA
jgi:hypothetical protein